MNTVDNTSIKSKVIVLLYRARQQQQEFVSGLSDAERNETGTPENWSVRDMIANLNAWKRMQAEKLATALRGEVPPVWKEGELVNAINAQIYTDAQYASWQAVLDESEQAFTALLTQVESMSEEELTDLNRYDWQDGEALWGETLGNGAWFPFTQMADYYYRHSDVEQAIRTHETLVAAIRIAGLPSEELGGALYNMACIYAKTGHSDKAMSTLSEALKLRPTLAE
ncbi:MAG TPA: ClbS/DfsB family four-helix bundle protein, partial [Ktedonobacteraceae bacterium]|nr:ClbS/DfsB family four-helix bundle protein [Ktedonobacteraceae bacterium]